MWGECLVYCQTYRKKCQNFDNMRMRTKAREDEFYNKN